MGFLNDLGIAFSLISLIMTPVFIVFGEREFALVAIGAMNGLNAAASFIAHLKNGQLDHSTVVTQ